MRVIDITIPGAPVGKGRPRRGRGRGMYTPKATLAYAKLARDYASLAMLGQPPMTGPIHAEIIAVFEPAKSWSKAKVARTIHRPHTQKPDIDNIEKALLDAFSGIVFDDDAQVFSTSVRKIWGLEAKAVVRLTEYGEWFADIADGDYFG